MERRRDAGLALVRLLGDRPAIPGDRGPRRVWTSGHIALDPGARASSRAAPNLFQFRDADPAVLERSTRSCIELVAAANRDGRCPSSSTISQSLPALMDERLMAALEAAAERHAPGKHTRMPSGAGHDAQYLARKMPAAMLFVPSIGGISHHWARTPPTRISCSARRCSATGSPKS